MKRKETSDMLNDWRYFLNRSQEKKVISERVFYGSKNKSVVSQTDISAREKDYVVYDDYISLINRKPFSAPSSASFITKKEFFDSKRPYTEEDAIGVILDYISKFYPEPENENAVQLEGEDPLSDEEFELISDRVKDYIKAYPDIFKDQNTVIIRVRLPIDLKDPQIQSQMPKVTNPDIESGQRVDFKIGTKIYDPKDKEFTSGDKEKGTAFKIKREKLDKNVYWALHDLGHGFFESIYEEGSGYDPKYNEEFFKKTYKDANKIVGRKIDRFDLSMNSKDLHKYPDGDKSFSMFNIRKVINKYTPGVGSGDQEYSICILLMKMGLKKTSDLIFNYLLKNPDYIHPKAIEKFNIDVEKMSKSELKEMREYVEDVLMSYMNFINAIFNDVKLIITGVA